MTPSLTPKHAPTAKNALDIPTLAADLCSGHRAARARAITLLESRRADHQA
jgi:LAO/AO transport system kinase